MQRADQILGILTSGATQQKPFTQQMPSSEEDTALTIRRAMRFWSRMVEMYSDKWAAKNGATPSSLWIKAIGKLSDEQILAGIAECLNQCMNEGNRYAPDLSDFMVYVSRQQSNEFGLTVDDVMVEFRKYLRERYMHSCPETYPWKHPVLYQIVCDMRHDMVQQNLTEAELVKRAAHYLKDWAARVRAGGVVPKPRPLLSENASSPHRFKRGPGFDAAMEQLAKLRKGRT